MKDIKTYTLQRIILPDGDFGEQEELFYQDAVCVAEWPLVRLPVATLRSFSGQS